MSELQYIARQNVPYKLGGRGSVTWTDFYGGVRTIKLPFRIGWLRRGERVPGDHPAVQQLPECFREATAKDLRGSVFVGYLPREDE